MGLIILGTLAVYLLVSVFVTRKAADWAKDNKRKPWLWGGVAAFMMYNLVFWDLIPTLVMHKYYCATQAGFWVYKTPDQWNAENPNGLEEIKQENQAWSAKYLEEWKRKHPASGTSVIEDMLKKNEVPKDIEELKNGGYRYWIMQRFNVEIKQDRNYSHAIDRTEKKLFDAKNNMLIAHYITFWRGKGGGVFGLGGTLDELRQALVLGWGQRTCVGEGNPPNDEFNKFTNQLHKLGE